ncbi:MAG: type VI secretion system tube protein Hcp [Pseudomonadota bacterium]
MATDDTDDAFLYFDLKPKAINGESTDNRKGLGPTSKSPKERKAFSISTFGFNIQNDQKIGTGVNAPSGGSDEEAGKAKLEAITVKKLTDRATPDLIHACAKGLKYKWAKIELRRNGLTYMFIEMEDAIVTKVNTEQSDDSEPTDSVTVEYVRIKITYYEQATDGDVYEVSTTGWDREKNEEWSG